MFNLNDIDNYAPTNKWKTKINNFFNVNLEDRDIYTVFEMSGIKKDKKQKNGREFYVFHKNDVEPKLYDGSIRNAIMRLKDNKNTPLYSDNQTVKKQTNFSLNSPNDERIVKRGRRNIILPKSDNEVVNDDSEYRNGENDMERYSDYLINNVYQFESLIKKTVTESLNRLLK